MSEPDLVLHQFDRSHFNEKVRWTLAAKQLPHRRITYLPGPHMPQIRKLSGQTQTPVLAIGGEIVAGSAAILERLERDHPERPLLPADPEDREHALGIQREFDEQVGPAARTALFSVLLEEPGYIVSVFGGSKSAVKRTLYRATLPVARSLMAKAQGTGDPANVARAFERCDRALDFVAKQSAATGYLVGERFSVADLCCASLLAPLTATEHPDMAWPDPRPDRLVEFHARWSGHAGIAWVQRMYREHRA